MNIHMKIDKEKYKNLLYEGNLSNNNNINLKFEIKIKI